MNDANCQPVDVIRTLRDLDTIRANIRACLEIRDGVDEDVPTENAGKFHIMLCFDTGCISSGAVDVKRALVDAVEKEGIGDRVSIVETGCTGLCAGGPVAMVYPGGYYYNKISPGDAPRIVTEHIVGGKPVASMLFRHPVTGEPIPLYKDIPFIQLQNARVLHNKGRVNHGSVEEYIGSGGYFGLYRAIHDLKPEEIISEVKKAGLRGRGGAGFPTAVKWDMCRRADGDRKYILCNADEGDPGAFMDRSLIEAHAYAVLEGMMIGARAIGATKGYIYCRAEYPLAVERLNHAIAECRRRGLLGQQILGSDFCFDLEIAHGSGAFVCGEETALMRSIEGQRGEPRCRPPFPANKGLWDMPSVLNNVETFANVPLILSCGTDWYRSAGTEKSPGTKILALTGKVNNVGLVEVNMGLPLGDIIYDIGGGIPNDKKYKAAQLGGPSGGCIPKQHLSVPVDYESVADLGAIMGSGGLIVMDEDTCMVDIARFFLEFTQDESCGKCTPCRVGTKRMLEILQRICNGGGVDGDIERLCELGARIKDSALCGLGQTAPNPVLSTIRYFRDEYVAHIRDKKCPAGVCAALITAPCTNTCPAGVYVPGFVSLVGEKRYTDALRLHRDRNPLAAVCASVCYHPCESKCRRATIDAPINIRAIKRFMVDQEESPVLPEIRSNKANAARKIAIVGAGPAGLSCAYFLARMGYKPDIFEAAEIPGGMLSQVIPTYRLNRKTLDREIEMILWMGVKLKTGHALGRDFTLADLKSQGYQAVFLGVGAALSMKMGLKNEDAPGVWDGIDFLREFNMKGALKVGKRVVVVGGGNVAIDVARTARRLGATDVTIVYRRTLDEMPAYKEEIHEGMLEGVKLELLAAPLEITVENGRAAGVRCSRMELSEFDSSGRRHPRAKQGEEFVIDADQVVAAVGQLVDGSQVINGVNLELTRNGAVVADPVTGRTSEEWVFAGGDAVTGPSSVIEAIAAGERAAVGIDTYLTGECNAFWRGREEVDTFFDPAADPIMTPRGQDKLQPPEKRRGFKEVNLAWDARTAIREAKRCLRCDYRESTTSK